MSALSTRFYSSSSLDLDISVLSFLYTCFILVLYKKYLNWTSESMQCRKDWVYSERKNFCVSTALDWELSFCWKSYGWALLSYNYKVCYYGKNQTADFRQKPSFMWENSVLSLKLSFWRWQRSGNSSYIYTELYMEM